MRLRDEIVDYKNEEKSEDEIVSQSYSIGKVVVVGYALTFKKIKRFLQPKLQRLARNKGILFVAIDQSRPLFDQGPFDIVLHKLSGKEWGRVLEVGVLKIPLFTFSIRPLIICNYLMHITIVL